MKSFRVLLMYYILMCGIILIIFFSSILYVDYSNKKIHKKYNVSVGETLIKCLNGSYEKSDPEKLFVCNNEQNPNFKLS